MNENTLNAASTQTSTGSNWFSQLLNAAGTVGAAYLSRDEYEDRPPTPVAPATNNTPLLLIGGGVALLLVLVFAFRK